MQNWLNNLIRRLGLALLKFSFNDQTKRQRELRSAPLPEMVLVWTRDEAEIAWKAGRTEVDLATMLSQNATSTKTATSYCVVDGRPAVVVVCLNDEVRRRILAMDEKKAWEEQWRKNGCFKDAFGNWVVPDELMWRSLPRGEDR